VGILEPSREVHDCPTTTRIEEQKAEWPSERDHVARPADAFAEPREFRDCVQCRHIQECAGIGYAGSDRFLLVPQDMGAYG
jgi:hypothetical protein